MKHLKWFSLVLAVALVLVGCGSEDGDNILQPAPEHVAYVVSQLALTISSVNTVTEDVQRDLYNVGNAPNDLQLRGDVLYVVNTLDSNLQMIDLNTGVSEFIDLGEGSSPEKVALISDTKAYVTAGTADLVKVVDLAGKSVVKEIPVGVAPWGIAVTGGKAYVVNSNYDFTNFAARQGSLSVIDIGSESVIETIPLGVNPQEIALAPNGQLLVLCTGNYADVMGNVTPIDPATNTAQAPIDLETIPSGIVVRPDGMAFVTYSNFLTGESGLLELDTDAGTLAHSVANPLIAGTAGMGMAVDSQGQLYVAVPDWDGSNPDRLLMLSETGDVVGDYVIGDGGGAASFVAVRE